MKPRRADIGQLGVGWLVEVVGFHQTYSGAADSPHATSRCSQRYSRARIGQIADSEVVRRLQTVAVDNFLSVWGAHPVVVRRDPSPAGPWKSSVGFSSQSCPRPAASEGPIARTITFFGCGPVTMNPPMSTLSPVSTRRRVEMLRGLVAGGAAVPSRPIWLRVVVPVPPPPKAVNAPATRSCHPVARSVRRNERIRARVKVGVEGSVGVQIVRYCCVPFRPATAAQASWNSPTDQNLSVGFYAPRPSQPTVWPQDRRCVPILPSEYRADSCCAALCHCHRRQAWWNSSTD